MSHHTSNSLKAYCCDRTISPADGLISRPGYLAFSTAVGRLIPRSSFGAFSFSLSLSLSSSIYSYPISLFFLPASGDSRLRPGRAGCRARYGGRRKTPLCEGRIIRSSVPTALRRSVAAAPPHPLPVHHPPTPTRTGALRASPTLCGGNSPPSSSTLARVYV